MIFARQLSIYAPLQKWPSIFVCAAALAFGACGGGSSGTPSGGGNGGGGGGVTPPNTTWVSGQFSPEASYKDRCQVPRAGTNDIAGSTLIEKFWQRSWSNRTYLWYDEITDRNPASIADRLDYFDTLKTEAVTASGTPKDQFHYTIPTDEYQEQLNSGASPGYGARFRIITPTIPREVRVAYTEPTGPANSAGLARGAQILAVNGVSVITATNQADIDTLNEGLFSPKSGTAYTFIVRDLGANFERTVMMTPTLVTTAPVRESKVIDAPLLDGSIGKIGYVLFNTFGTAIAEDALFDAFTDLQAQNIDELILDLRYNGGGLLDISSQLGFMIAGQAQTTGRTFESLQFNDKYPTTNPVTGAQLSPRPFLSTGQNFSVPNGTPLPSVNLSRVYILTTASTCSASEALINALNGIGIEVIQIGTRTCGKPYGFYGTDNCGETYFTIQFRGVNDLNFGDYTDGFAPTDGTPLTIGEPLIGCEIGDDFGHALGDPDEAKMSAALDYIATGTCPAPIAAAKTDLIRTAVRPEKANQTPSSLLATPEARRRLFLEQSRILLDEGRR